MLNSGESVVLSGTAGDEIVYRVNLPSDAALFTVNLNGGTGDADLYVRAGAVPTLTQYDCRPFLDQTNNEECVIATPTDTTYYISVRAYRDFADATLSVVYALPSVG